jgi:uncharacterized integral membrane protein
MKNAKLIAAGIVAVLALIVFLQNGATVQLKLLWLARLETSLATALGVTFAAGLLTGFLVQSYRSHRRSRGNP